MTTREALDARLSAQGMALAEFMALDGKVELIDGQVIQHMPNPSGHSILIRIVRMLLENFLRGKGLYEVFSETTFVIPGREHQSNWVAGARIPDVMLLEAGQLHAWMASNPEYWRLPFPVIPDLVVEVLSENDAYSAVTHKVEVYLADGVKRVWLVDPQNKRITIHSIDGDTPRTLKGDDALTDPLLSGFGTTPSAVFAALR
jgi:Uma2 family endonuclease